MKKIMLIASAMSALSLPVSASAIELGDEGGLECGPYAKVGVVGGMITGAESARLDQADATGKKHLPLTTSMPFGGTLNAGITITPWLRAELGVMYLRNISAEVEVGKGKVEVGKGKVEVGKGKADSRGEIKADSGGGTDAPIRKRFKLTPPQPTIMPISIADRDFAIDIRNITQAQAQAAQPQLNDEQRAAARVAWLKNYAGIDYRVKDPNNPNGPMVINPVLLNIPQGNPNPVGNPPQRANQPADFAIHNHEQWRYMVIGLAALSNANKPSDPPVKVLSDKITQIYNDIRPFADIVGIDVPNVALPNSASVEQIQNKMQELNEILEEVRDSFEGFIGGNAFANQIQLNFVIPQQAQQQQQGQGQQQQAQATAQEAAAAAAVRLLNGNDQIVQLYKDLVKLKRHAGFKKSMDKLAAQQEEDAKQKEEDAKQKEEDAKQKEEDAKQKEGSCKKDDKEGVSKETEFDLSMIVGQVKLYADLVATESFSIYAGVGAGVAHTYGKIDEKDIKGHTGMVASGALGVAIHAAEGVYVDIEGCYMYSFSKIEEKYSINPLTANIAVRYNF
uniref:56 kDa type-specific antigen n=1 Tax=Orientia tsutsugamushi TaxID=784 RepID=A0A8A2F4P8_ORITS|nr:56-kDa type-specific antigen [Orientia tsutsugamushi]QSV11700.1 56-kDa type-specific antigen [Orientia tsutsugamushi]QSV11701.1 56-kDa type-specific antigen [Orientia tsutsugamushi]QSV11702.1 56-kDa type-specific antigen [Orientia tsutsugamushi]QSV11703.1 56-kDa type-specific antigen [Orientia tsutsugamushi]